MGEGCLSEAEASERHCLECVDGQTCRQQLFPQSVSTSPSSLAPGPNDDAVRRDRRDRREAMRTANSTVRARQLAMEGSISWNTFQPLRLAQLQSSSRLNPIAIVAFFCNQDPRKYPVFNNHRPWLRPEHRYARGSPDPIAITPTCKPSRISILDPSPGLRRKIHSINRISANPKIKKTTPPR